MIENLKPFSISQISLDPRIVECSSKSKGKSKDTITSSTSKTSTTFWGKVKSYFLTAWNWIKFRFLCCVFSDVEQRKREMIKEIQVAHDDVFFAQTTIAMKDKNPKKALKKISKAFDRLSKESQEKIKEEMLHQLKEVNFSTLTDKSREVVKDSLFNVLKKYKYSSFSSKVQKAIDQEWFESWKNCDELSEIKDNHIARIKTELFAILEAMDKKKVEEVCEELVPEIITKNPYCDLEFKNEDGDKCAFLIFADGIKRVLKELKPFIKVDLPES